MAITKSKKIAILDELTGSIASQKSVVLLSTKNAEVSLNAAANSEIRKAARNEGVALQVVKNTLINKTFTSVPELAGPTYLAYLVDDAQSDEVKVPKTMVQLVTKDFKDNFEVVGAVVNGEFYDSSKTIQLSKVPSFDQSMATVAGTLNSIISRIAIAVKEVPSSIARGVDAYAKTLS